MKVLVIRWERLLVANRTCPRCDSTEPELEKAMTALSKSLSTLGIRVQFVKDEVSSEEFGEDPTRSNRILINNRPLEDWVGGEMGQSRCCDVCGDSLCRTLVVGNTEHEVIHTDIIIKAGLAAASDMVTADSPCCGEVRKNTSCCPQK